MWNKILYQLSFHLLIVIVPYSVMCSTTFGTTHWSLRGVLVNLGNVLLAALETSTSTYGKIPDETVSVRTGVRYTVSYTSLGHQWIFGLDRTLPSQPILSRD
jgi:hypothetical protein